MNGTSTFSYTAKPCPFCGGPPRSQFIGIHWIECQHCGARGPWFQPTLNPGDKEACMQKAVDAWNARPTGPAWETVDTPKTLSHVMAPAQFMQIMAKAGYKLPCKVGSADIATLRDIAAADPRAENPWTELISLIERYETIRIWTEY
jgi:Lar family restriction alleviation protein